jgi:hypothetical protein
MELSGRDLDVFEGIIPDFACREGINKENP